VAEIVYGEPLRIPGELLAASPITGDPSELIKQLRRQFEQLRLVPQLRFRRRVTRPRLSLSTRI
jgi:hypothetical protein